MIHLLRFLPWYCPEDIEARNERTREVVALSLTVTAKATLVSDRVKALADSYRKADERLYRR